MIKDKGSKCHTGRPNTYFPFLLSTHAHSWPVSPKQMSCHWLSASFFFLLKNLNIRSVNRKRKRKGESWGNYKKQWRGKRTEGYWTGGTIYNSSAIIIHNWKLNQVYNAANEVYGLVVKEATSTYPIKIRKETGKTKPD